jgi:indolepyruvate ferredoxin oxidoreductase beta subunit
MSSRRDKTRDKERRGEVMINVMLCGVGGQGLVLTSGIISEVAKRHGFDVKSNDVVGLSQRGGRVWANVRMGDKVYSPNILPGDCDYLVALEPLEGYRYMPMLKNSGVILMNEKKVYPSDVVFEKTSYPEEEIEAMKEKYLTYALDATSQGSKLGNKMTANTILLGMLAAKLPIAKEIWQAVIKENVPEKALEINEKAFDFGYEYVNK